MYFHINEWAQYAEKHYPINLVFLLSWELLPFCFRHNDETIRYPSEIFSYVSRNIKFLGVSNASDNFYSTCISIQKYSNSNHKQCLV